ncbi:MAG: translation initiation factor IF-5A [Thermoproteota archaeon]|nr:MAG: translation initiation factor IF-5A [Candidatus Korarchaeota archaeon]
MSTTYKTAGELKKGHYIVIDGEACQIISVDKSKPGKHGAAKVRIQAIGAFDKKRREAILPVDARVEVPIIDKRVAQVTYVGSSEVQLMDLETFETFEAELPEDPDLREKLAVGAEVEYWIALNKRKIMGVRSKA